MTNFFLRSMENRVPHDQKRVLVEAQLCLLHVKVALVKDLQELPMLWQCFLISVSARLTSLGIETNWLVAVAHRMRESNIFCLGVARGELQVSFSENV